MNEFKLLFFTVFLYQCEAYWQKLATRTPPPARSHYVMVEVPATGTFLFGGTDNSAYFNDIWLLSTTKPDPADWEWHLQHQANSSLKPEKRSYATGVAHKPLLKPQVPSIYVFGGEGEGNKLFNDVFEYFPGEKKWAYTRNASTLVPPPRMGHSAINSVDLMIIFGGYVDDENSQVDDTTWSFNFSSSMWTVIELQNDPPVGRYGHSAIYFPSKQPNSFGYMLIFGGTTFKQFPHEIYLNDLWSFDISKKKWTQLTPPVRPPPRTGHASCYLKDDQSMYIFGGHGRSGIIFNDMWKFTTEFGWEEIRAVGLSPSSRVGASLVVIGTRIVLFGGEAGKEPESLDDTWVYSLSNATCTECEPGSFASEESLCAKVCPLGSCTEEINCTLCAAGTSANVTGRSAPCKPCADGHVAPKDGSTSCTACGLGESSNLEKKVCVPCHGGTFNDKIGGVCNPCGSGKFSLPNSQNCTYCPAGSYSRLLKAQSCQNCGRGRYSMEVGATSGSTCKLCPAGYFCSFPRTGRPSRCPENHYCPEGSSFATVCSAFYESKRGQRACVPTSGLFVVGGSGLFIFVAFVVASLVFMKVKSDKQQREQERADTAALIPKPDGPVYMGF